MSVCALQASNIMGEYDVTEFDVVGPISTTSGKPSVMMDTNSSFSYSLSARSHTLIHLSISKAAHCCQMRGQLKPAIELRFCHTACSRSRTRPGSCLRAYILPHLTLWTKLNPNARPDADPGSLVSIYVLCVRCDTILGRDSARGPLTPRPNAPNPRRNKA